MPNRFIRALLVSIGMAAFPLLATAAEDTPRDAELPFATVHVDGRPLFAVRGVSAYPPERRAAAIAARITAIARDRTLDPAAIQVVDLEHSSDVMLGQRLIVSIVDADAAPEGVVRRPLAAAYAQRVQAAITDYRTERGAAYLQRNAVFATIATVLFAIALWLTVRFTRWLLTAAEARSRRLAESVQVKSFHIVEAGHIWATIRGAVRAVRWLMVAALAYIYIQAVLERFPWTRPVSRRSLDYVVTPLTGMWDAFLGKIPDLIVLVILILIARYLLRLLRLFFEAVDRGTVKLSEFEQEWAQPTYRIVRYVVLILTAVVAYPYIPGSGSEAFKGISLFLGVMLSIGSTSFIANLIAGYALTYRRVLRVGDWIKIDDTIGEVTRTRVQVTHLRSLKNEEVTVPNSLILNSKVVNYTALCQKGGLILHTIVGIGYEVPWRQVEAMLMIAAQRTSGLLTEPAPFVLQRSLGDYAVNYELNVHTNEPGLIQELYTSLHRNILDVFNEYNIQIMTPSYMGDPTDAKVVPKDQWYAAPAAPPATTSAQRPTPSALATPETSA